MTYTPSDEQLERYGDLLVNFALGGGDGIKRGDVVRITAEECAKPLYAAACRAVWRAGGHVLGDFVPDSAGPVNVLRDFYEIAGDDQLDFFAEHYWRGIIDQCDHVLRILADNEPHALATVDPAKILRARRARRRAAEWQDEKESAGALTWTIGLYGTEGMAAEAGMDIEEYWREIIAACFLDDPDPAARWRQVNDAIQGHCARLNALPIERLRVEGDDVDLRLTLGERRRWVGGAGRNVPSFEVFTSPDWRGTEGRIRFSEPLYVHGSLIKGAELEFREGTVVAVHAATGAGLLKEIVASQNADRIGEFSLTDARLSPIRRFMANTLYDENTGGPFGNTHLAVGQSLHVAYDGDPSTVSRAEWERLGFNSSAIHTDIVSTTDRQVTATLADGSERVIYAGGRFTLD